MRDMTKGAPLGHLFLYAQPPEAALSAETEAGSGPVR